MGTFNKAERKTVSAPPRSALAMKGAVCEASRPQSHAVPMTRRTISFALRLLACVLGFALRLEADELR
ncbi:MAG TPA: hypothetical protein VI454_02785, partial [Verrucomicrobiae bacterium]